MNERIIGIDDARYKIIMVGDINVGKTALVWRYTEGEFLANKSTIVTTIDFKMKSITINNQPVKLYIWDTAGSEKYRSIVSTYFKGCQGVIMVFDMSRDNWHPLAESKTEGCVFVLVGNKCDLDKRVEREEIKKWCDSKNIHFIETSVKENKNVMEVYEWTANKIYICQAKSSRPQSLSLQAKKDNKSNSNSKCCKG